MASTKGNLTVCVYTTREMTVKGVRLLSNTEVRCSSAYYHSTCATRKKSDEL